MAVEVKISGTGLLRRQVRDDSSIPNSAYRQYMKDLSFDFETTAESEHAIEIVTLRSAVRA
jgi:hypothetical protein